MKITHLSIYRINDSKVFDNINSYAELNNAISSYGKSGSEEEDDNYNIRVGEAFEVFTQFFCLKYGSTPLLGINQIVDTSDSPFNEGFDFTFTDMKGDPGQIQSKWRSDPSYQFTIGDLATNGEMARNLNIGRDNNILFLNFDDSDKLFHYRYTSARNARRIIGRNSQEEFILRDPSFWDDFRKCIKDSAKIEFKDPYQPRDVQDWILNGITKSNGEVYEGTEKVLDGTYSKGRVEASTGCGKTLCQFYNIKRSFDVHNKNLAVMILPTRSLIDQTFREFYEWKMFGSDTEKSNVSCLIIRSGTGPRYSNKICNVLQTLSVKEAVDFIDNQISEGKKVVMFTTMKSRDLKYSDIVKGLNNIVSEINAGISSAGFSYEDALPLSSQYRIGLEIVDEYHNFISNSGERKAQLEMAEYLQNNTDRCDGTIFYSASNKRGTILDSYNEDLFGKLLCKVTRNDLRERGYVCPKLVFKIVRVKNRNVGSELKREGARLGLDIEKAQSEAVGIVAAYKDLCNYYYIPNMITFGDHVEGCRYIAESKELKENLPGISNHFMCADTPNNERIRIMDEVRNSGGNIIHQHSIAKEGINIQNLHSCVIGRGLGIISTQQTIGRSDRSLPDDTQKFLKGELKLSDGEGWKKYYNLYYVIVDSDELFYQRVREIVGYLLDSGIPSEEWDISQIDDEGKGGAKHENGEFMPRVEVDVKFDGVKFKKMIEDAKIEIIEEDKRVKEELEEMKERDRLNSMTKLDLLREKLGSQ